MNAHADISAEEALEAEGPLDPDGARTDEMLGVLARLTELGMVPAERLVAQATAEDATPVDAGPNLGEVATAFAKISRGVRMTVMLEAKLLKARRLRRDGLEAAQAAKLEAMRAARQAEEQAEAQAEEDARVEQHANAIDEAVKAVSVVARSSRRSQIASSSPKRAWRSPSYGSLSEMTTDWVRIPDHNARRLVPDHLFAGVRRAAA
jgi:hypothetical protein